MRIVKWIADLFHGLRLRRPVDLHENCTCGCRRWWFRSEREKKKKQKLYWAARDKWWSKPCVFCGRTRREHGGRLMDVCADGRVFKATV
jgi:hypothetical protein